MYGISDKIHECDRMGMLIGDGHMTVIPTDDLLRNESERYSSEYPQGSRDIPSRRTNHLRKQVKEYISKQSACREADKPQNDPLEQ